MAATGSSRRPLRALLHTSNLSAARFLASFSSSNSALRASSAVGSFSAPCIWTLRPGHHQPPHTRASTDWRRASGRAGTAIDMSHNRTSSTLRARAALASHGAGNRRWLSSAEGGGASEKALSALSKAIEEGDDAAVQQLASSLSKKAAARLVEELSQQNKVNVVAGDDSKVVRVEDFVNIDRNADGVITSQEFERFIRESNEHKQVSEPTRSQLWMVALASSVPFVGFGFMDNAIMILAGEVIEAKVGVAFGLTTMAAAAIGNLISDVCGVGLGGTVEVVAAKFGCKQPALSTEQMQMRCTQLTSNMGAAVGVALGCFLGMFPLLFMKGREDEEDEEDAGAAHAHTHGHGPHGHGAHTHAHAHGSASK